MWFDTRAKMAEIATQAPAARPVSQVSQVSQPPEAQKPAFHVASVATVATPTRSKPEQTRPDAAAFPYGTACGLGLMPKTWTGRVVSLADWRTLSEWDRHGPNGRDWCGLCQGWHWPGDCEDGGGESKTACPLQEPVGDLSLYCDPPPLKKSGDL